MSEIKNQGVPNKRTKGALGDICIDSSTGMKYRCTGSTTMAGQTEYEWTKVASANVETPPVKEETKAKTEEKPKAKTEEKPKAEAPVDTKAKTEEKPKATPSQQSNKDRTAYNKQYNNKQ